MTRFLIFVFWPSFLVAGAAEGLFFTAFDPTELTFFGEPVTWSRLAVYSTGFFAFWVVAAASSAFTCFFQRSADEINQCPIKIPTDRPHGCPKRHDPDAACS